MGIQFEAIQEPPRAFPLRRRFNIYQEVCSLADIDGGQAGEKSVKLSSGWLKKTPYEEIKSTYMFFVIWVLAGSMF